MTEGGGALDDDDDGPAGRARSDADLLAAHVAGDPDVVGVVALAPWLPLDEPHQALAGRHLRAAHGRTDKITSARATRAFVDRARPVAASVDFRDMGRVGHYMFRRVDAWNAFAIEHSLELLG